MIKLKNLLHFLLCSCSTLIFAFISAAGASDTPVNAVSAYTEYRIYAVNDYGMRYSGCGLLGISDYLLGKKHETRTKTRKGLY